jgi:serine/threonine protein kinase
MSPEQARGEQLDPRTDLFSLGIVLYERATSKLPFNGHTPAIIFDAILNREPVSVLECEPALPPELARIIARALEKDRKLRYQSAADLRGDIERLERSRSAGHSASTMSSIVAARRKSRTRIALAVRV